VEDGLVTPGLASVAVAVLDHNAYPVAAVAVTYPTDSSADVADLVTAVRASAHEVSRRILGRA
jgi:DNA-binding IclR family transcriptional regulator